MSPPRSSHRFLCLISSFVGLLGWGPAPLHAADPAVDFFEQKIRPLLVGRCQGCHSSVTGKTSGGLALDTRQGWATGGDGGPAIVPG
ncbi:MAG: c-type cytochrome domain-containing protein, partial [Planctomycetaceae bacterium]